MATNGTTGKAHEGGNILSGENPIKFNMDDPLPLFIVQTIIILSLCYGMNILMHRIRQPRVVSEVLSGIILGPSIMGKIPGFQETIFPKESINFLNLVANLGLVLFLFLVGLELDPKLILKRAKHALGISVAGLVIPFAFSCGVAMLLYHQFEQPTDLRPSPPFGEFLLTCGVAMSLTAFPVLARILAEMQLMSTTVGFITVCAAAAGDIVAWILLALLVSLINATTPIMPVYVLLMALAWCIVLVYAVRPLLLSLVRLTHSEEEPSQKMIAITLVIVLTSAFVTNTIGIHAIFGGFLVGLLIPHDSGFAEGLTRRIEDLVGVYFLPIFFACSGLKTEVGLLNNGLTWGLVIMVTLISFLGKMVGCAAAARANGMTWREAVSIGFLMQCKGLVEYIILNIGHDAGVISDRVFVILITMCIFLTMVSTPFVSYLYPVSYQKELEVRREAERKKKALMPKGHKDNKRDGGQPKGFLSRLTNKLRRRRAAASIKDQEDLHNGQDHYEDLDGVHIDGPDRDSGQDEEETKEEQAWKKRNSIMFCLDKTPNAPGVMTLLQLFSGTAIHRHPKSMNPRSDGAAKRDEKSGEGSENTNKGHHGVLQPSIDISDPEGNRRQKQGSKALPEYEVGYSKIYAIRLLHISERTSAAMLTASRCMDRLYKDTVMMMVMAFAKLNSVPLKPLVAISTDTAQSTVAQDILDRAEDLNVGWIVYPWNSSHLTDLPSSVSGLPSGGGHLQPGIMMSMANTTATAHSTMSIPGTPAGTSDPAHVATLFAALPDPTPEPPRQFPYNISRYFDHDEAQKIASGGHVDLSQSGQSHRTSIASNTKVLSKLIPSSASSNIATAVLVDRGLGLFGGVEHLVIPLLGGEDDYEALCLASCLARNTRCFVTILRIATTQNSSHPHPSTLSDAQQRTSHTHAQSIPGTPDIPMHRPVDGPLEGAKLTRHSSRVSEDKAESKLQPSKRSTIDLVPKDDEALFKRFFPCKPPFQGDSQRHRQQILQKNISLDRTGLGHYAQRSHSFLESQMEEGEDVDDLELEEGIMVLRFQELADALLWARSCLTAQDLMVIGFDSPLSRPSYSPGYSEAPSNRPMTVGFSRVPSMEDGRVSGVESKLYSPSANSSQVTSPPSILERRGVNLSPPHSESPHLPPTVYQRLQPLQNASLNVSVISTASAAPTPLPQAAFDEERTGRSRAVGSTRAGRSLSRKARSLRSLSRGRRPETPGAGASSLHHLHLGGHSSTTTCQVMLGLAADMMMQSCVSSSLLVVRSRWFAERQRGSNEIGSPFAGVSQFKLHMTPSVVSHHRRRSSEQSYQRMHDQTRQYHSQQQQHHARQHSKLSEELIRDLDRDADPVLGNTNPSSARARAPDVTFVNMSGASHTRARTDMETPRMSRESL
ncbi:hypothetical protein KVV02_001549 [Mortierella alpina]|uniref:Cation/H+ exchanger transmembrane domain-containing protein n=1 Tax=Mortierella alpina TaxID=64518 RepID=A0A9P8CVT2_MORAP|nr:hypothetical protein KVV02_001549 [Mortierella alpina]